MNRYRLRCRRISFREYTIMENIFTKEWLVKADFGPISYDERFHFGLNCCNALNSILVFLLHCL